MTLLFLQLMSIWGYDCRHFVVQVYQTGVRLLDGAKMTQELLFTSLKLEGVPDLPSNLAVEATIADPFVLLKMADGSLQLIIGGMIVISLPASRNSLNSVSSSVLVSV